jgi:hypothetical protein
LLYKPGHDHSLEKKGFVTAMSRKAALMMNEESFGQKVMNRLV